MVASSAGLGRTMDELQGDRRRSVGPHRQEQRQRVRPAVSEGAGLLARHEVELPDCLDPVGSCQRRRPLPAERRDTVERETPAHAPRHRCWTIPHLLVPICSRPNARRRTGLLNLVLLRTKVKEVVRPGEEWALLG